MRRALLLLAACRCLSAVAAAAERPRRHSGRRIPSTRQSTLPFHAPPFDKIKDKDYQPAIEAGMAQQLAEIQAIAHNPAPPTFENTFVPLEKSGRLLDRSLQAFDGVTGANTNPTCRRRRRRSRRSSPPTRTPFILNAKLFARISAIYEKARHAAASTRSRSGWSRSPTTNSCMPEPTCRRRTRSGSRRSMPRTRRSRIPSARSCWPPTRRRLYRRRRPEALAGMSDAQLAAAAEAAQGPSCGGLPRAAAEHDAAAACSAPSRCARRGRRSSTTPGTAPSAAMRTTRVPSCRGSRSCARSARSCWGFPIMPHGSSRIRWRRRPRDALEFMDALVPLATARAEREGKEIQAVIDAQHGGFTLEPWDWDFYARAGAQGEVRPERCGRSSRTSSSTTCSRTACSMRPTGSTGSPSRSARTSRCISRMCGCSM